MRYDIAQLKRKQLSKGWTDVELSERSGVPRTTIRDMFARGSAHPSTVKAVARPLGCKLEELIIDDEAA